MRPLFPYYGSKWSMARHYPAPVGQVIEPFAGAAGYSTFYNVPNARLIDADPIIVGVWSYLLRVTPAEIMALPEMPNTGDSVDDFPLPQEAKWLIGFWINRGSASPKKTRTAYSSRSDKKQSIWGRQAKERVASHLDMIRGWTITQGDFSTAPDVDATWFIDPPYVDKGKYYRVKFTDFDRLAKWCDTRRGKLIVCEGPGASWMDFKPLGRFMTSTGHALEYVFLREGADQPAFI